MWYMMVQVMHQAVFLCSFSISIFFETRYVSTHQHSVHLNGPFLTGTVPIHRTVKITYCMSSFSRNMNAEASSEII